MKFNWVGRSQPSQVFHLQYFLQIRQIRGSSTRQEPQSLIIIRRIYIFFELLLDTPRLNPQAYGT